MVEDDPAMRGLLREHLVESYEVIETGDPTEALAQALEHKPDCILLDLMLPGFSGFELCQMFSSLSLTRLTPVCVITAKPAAEYKDFCLNLGAADYFEKPVNFAQLKARLAVLLEGKRDERRRERRVRLSVILKLRGQDAAGNPFESLTAADDVSGSGFLCACQARLEKGSQVEVFLMGGQERYVGRAEVMRTEWRDRPWQRYGFQFVEKPREWILQ
jgi:CheY-like chemotaxis protein